jgi:hypothetical protein
MVAAVAFMAAAPACYGATSLLDGFIKNFSKQGMILELRALPDSSYDIIWLKGDKVMMNKIRDKENYIQTPLRTYDIEALKKLGGGAGKAHGVFAGSDAGRKSPLIIIALTLRDKEGGGYEFLVHASYPKPDSYRRSFVVDAATWQMAEKFQVLEESPRTGYWSKEEQQAASTDIEAIKSISTSASAAAAAAEDAEAAEGDKPQAQPGGEQGGGAEAPEGGQPQVKQEGEQGGEEGAAAGERAGRGGRGGGRRNRQEQESGEQAQ